MTEELVKIFISDKMVVSKKIIFCEKILNYSQKSYSFDHYATNITQKLV